MTLLYDFFPIEYNKLCTAYTTDGGARLIQLKDRALDIVHSLHTPISGIEAIKFYLNKGGVSIPHNAFVNSMPLIDIISNSYTHTTTIIQKELSRHLQNGEKIIARHHAPLNSSDLLPQHQILYLVVSSDKKVTKHPLIAIYQAQACYSFKIIGKTRYCTIDTILSFMYAWLLADRNYLNNDNINCLLSWLLYTQYVNLHKNSYTFNMFEQKCYGRQRKLEDAKRDLWNKGKDQVVYRPRN
jgi:hypothetical protein